jgi:hypothetical protein
MESGINKNRGIKSNREFNTDWELKYFFIELNEKPLCLICNTGIAINKTENIRRHYETKHAKDYNKYIDNSREKVLISLKKQLNSQQTLFLKQQNINSSAVKASYIIAENIAKNMKSYSDGECEKLSFICC